MALPFVPSSIRTKPGPDPDRWICVHERARHDITPSIPSGTCRLFRKSWHPGLGFARRLTLISAPAGFGKTTLVSVWIQQLGHAVAWLSLDEDDNDFSRFLTYVIAALQQVDPVLGETTRMVVEAAPSTPVGPRLREVEREAGGQLPTELRRQAAHARAELGHQRHDVAEGIVLSHQVLAALPDAECTDGPSPAGGIVVEATSAASPFSRNVGLRSS